MRRVLTLVGVALALLAPRAWGLTSTVSKSTQVVTSWQGGEWRVVLSSGMNTVGIDDNKLRVETYQEPFTTDTVKIANGGNTAQVDASGRLAVYLAGTNAPSGVTVASFTSLTNIANGATVDAFYAVPSGKTLTLQEFSFSNTPGTGKYMEYYLYDDVNGNLTGMSLLHVYHNEVGTFGRVDLSDALLGNGTRRFLLRVTAQGAAFEVFRSWQGYVQ